LIEGLTKLQGVVLTAAVTDDVVSVPFERHATHGSV
jgi:hypothetical protein